MESNGVGAQLGGWGMSIATQRAKERENRTLDVKVTVKTVKHGRLMLQGSDIRGRAGFPGPDVQYRTRKCALGAGCPAWGPDVRPDGPDVRPDDSRSGFGLRNSIWGGNG